ncbi:hypothetical protein CEXT_386031 [Caerostris extrusa]|uniref:Uncharacterized protein n=1 Tax=Caerostris extrusa TaxID=172846 RepID=A0AAV4RST5_CAEEX|nr:hypothetical protein CEXT_386031 [Caerostris extrusa]
MVSGKGRQEQIVGSSSMCGSVFILGESGWGLWVSADLLRRLEALIVARTNVPGRAAIVFPNERTEGESAHHAFRIAEPRILRNSKSFFSLSLSLFTH